MFRLLHIEWLKFSKNNVIWVMLGLFALLLPAKLSIGSSMKDLPSPLPNTNIFTEFPTVWDFLGYNGSWQTFFFLGFLTIYIVTSEYTNSTAKQSIIQGMTRKEYFWSKLSTIFTISFFVSIYFFVVGAITGITHTEAWTVDMIFQQDFMVLRFFLMTLSYCTFAFLIALLLRKTGLSLLIYFSYVLFLEPMIRWVFHSNVFPGRSQIFYPMNSTEDLCPLPIYNMIGDFMQKEGSGIELLSPTEAMVIVPIYIVSFVGIAYYVFMNRDI